MIRRLFCLALLSLTSLSFASGVAHAQVTIDDPGASQTVTSGDTICVDGSISWAGGTTAPYGVKLLFNGITLFGQIGTPTQDPKTMIWSARWKSVSPNYVAPTVTLKTKYTLTAQPENAMGVVFGTAASVDFYVQP